MGTEVGCNFNNREIRDKIRDLEQKLDVLLNYLHARDNEFGEHARENVTDALGLYLEHGHGSPINSVSINLDIEATEPEKNLWHYMSVSQALSEYIHINYRSKSKDFKMELGGVEKYTNDPDTMDLVETFYRNCKFMPLSSFPDVSSSAEGENRFVIEGVGSIPFSCAVGLNRGRSEGRLRVFLDNDALKKILDEMFDNEE